MTHLFVLLPLFALVAVFIFLINLNVKSPIRSVILRSMTVVGVYAVISLELLSPLHLVTRPALIMIWSVPLIAFSVWFLIRRRAGIPIALPALKFKLGWGEWLAFSAIAIILLLTAFIAWRAPPMTWDSMTYHMSRIAHWAENQSIGHYITGIERQNSMSPGAEMITLHGYLLAGSDRFASFTEWFAMLGSVIGVSLVARNMGGRRYAQWLAALFAVSLPMGIVQASSTITDYVVAFWLVCLAVEVTHYQKSEDNHAVVFAVLASGMAVLTKPTCIPYLLPLIVWMIVLIIRRMKPVIVFKWAVLAVCLVGLITGGYVARNLTTFGGLSNPIDFQNHVNQLRTPAGFFSNVLKNAALHAGTPSEHLNNELDILIRKVHVKIGVDIMDPRTTGDGWFMIRKPS
ncbi:MAG: glycosyltransferase family 39 protein, partial [Anaerolineaceae bacterium]|nr:glycosyltransferase family 39 protein [Anaerolineaceae bacterium]